MTGEAQRRLILHMSVSLDGFVGGGDGAIDRLGTGEQHGATRHHANLEMIGQAGLIVIGRGAYEQMVQAWPSSDSPMGRLINRLPKVVFSDGLDTVNWENARQRGPARAGDPAPEGRARPRHRGLRRRRIGHSLIRHRLPTSCA